MCEHDHGSSLEPEARPGGHSRRAFLTRVALAGSAVLMPQWVKGLGGITSAKAALPRQYVNANGLTAYPTAMHLHGSFSEGQGAWAQHFSEAIRTGVRVVVPTDHDWRVEQRNYGGEFHFSSWSETTPSGFWRLTQRTATTNKTPESGGTLVTSHAPDDLKSGAGALRIFVKSTTTAVAKVVYDVDSSPSNHDIQGSVLGRSLHVWVLPSLPSTVRTYLAVNVSLARDPTYGQKQITYRLRTDLTTAPPPTVAGPKATIDVPVRLGRWYELAPDVLADITACWPDLLAEDNSINKVYLQGVGTKAAAADGLFSYVRFVPEPAYDPLASLSSVIGYYRAAHRDLLVPHGLEHSVDVHLGQVGGDPFLYPYPNSPGTGTHSNFGGAVARDQVAQIQSHGGVASYNHPFGTGSNSPSGTLRANILTATMKRVLASGCYGADMIEIGYVARGMDLAGHLELFDCLSANGKFLTATGVSDDHGGLNWAGQKNRFVTIPWMVDLSETSLKSALKTGRASVGLLGTFTGAVDMSINGVAYMGQVYSGPERPTDALLIDGFGLPSGSAVQVWSGPVDKGGVSFQRPTVVATKNASDFDAAGRATVPATGAGARYYRCTVVDSSGQVLAFTNPVWRT